MNAILIDLVRISLMTASALTRADVISRLATALGDLLEQLFGRRVELVTPESLSPFLRPHILAEATDVLRAA
jgi:predicted nucleotidyltransferase